MGRGPPQPMKGSATAGRASLLEFEAFGKAGTGTTVPLQAQAVPAYWRFLAQFLFRFLESCSDNYQQNNLKITNKIKAIKCVGCLPRSARLESLA